MKVAAEPGLAFWLGGFTPMEKFWMRNVKFAEWVTPPPNEGVPVTVRFRVCGATVWLVHRVMYPVPGVEVEPGVQLTPVGSPVGQLRPILPG